jgi:hypothetical protein
MAAGAAEAGGVEAGFGGAAAGATGQPGEEVLLASPHTPAGVLLVALAAGTAAAAATIEATAVAVSAATDDAASVAVIVAGEGDVKPCAEHVAEEGALGKEKRGGISMGEVGMEVGRVQQEQLLSKQQEGNPKQQQQKDQRHEQQQQQEKTQQQQQQQEKKQQQQQDEKTAKKQRTSVKASDSCSNPSKQLLKKQPEKQQSSKSALDKKQQQPQQQKQPPAKRVSCHSTPELQVGKEGKEHCKGQQGKLGQEGKQEQEELLRLKKSGLPLKQEPSQEQQQQQGATGAAVAGSGVKRCRGSSGSMSAPAKPEVASAGPVAARGAQAAAAEQKGGAAAAGTKAVAAVAEQKGGAAAAGTKVVAAVAATAAAGTKVVAAVAAACGGAVAAKTEAAACGGGACLQGVKDPGGSSAPAVMPSLTSGKNKSNDEGLDLVMQRRPQGPPSLGSEGSHQTAGDQKVPKRRVFGSRSLMTQMTPEKAPGPCNASPGLTTTADAAAATAGGAGSGVVAPAGAEAAAGVGLRNNRSFTGPAAAAADGGFDGGDGDGGLKHERNGGVGLDGGAAAARELGANEAGKQSPGSGLGVELLITLHEQELSESQEKGLPGTADDNTGFGLVSWDCLVYGIKH